MTVHVGIVLIGVALLVLTAWSWRGQTARSRWWVPTLGGRHLVLGVLPGLGVLVSGGGLMAMTRGMGEALFGATVLVVGLPMLVGVVLEFAGMFGLLPKWWGPRWYRDKVRKQRRKPFYGF